MRNTIFAALIILVAAAAEAKAGGPIYVGILEGALLPGAASSAVSAQPHVRMVFRKDGADWEPMPSNFSTRDTVQWTVVFDGRALGNAASRSPGERHWVVDSGAQILATKAAPAIRMGAADFIYGGQKAATRPLMLVSGRDTSASWDPQRWKPSRLSAEERQRAIAAFRSKVTASERCDGPEQPPVHHVAYADSAVTVVKSYRSRDGELLFGVRLNDPKANCGFFDDETFFDYWFVLDHQHVRYLDSQMTPVDTADLDGKGQSAWLFFSSRKDNDDGYELFTDDFTKKVQFRWSYH